MFTVYSVFECENENEKDFDDVNRQDGVIVLETMTNEIDVWNKWDVEKIEEIGNVEEGENRCVGMSSRQQYDKTFMPCWCGPKSTVVAFVFWNTFPPELVSTLTQLDPVQNVLTKVIDELTIRTLSEVAPTI